jgi:hypothetical protein
VGPVKEGVRDAAAVGRQRSCGLALSRLAGHNSSSSAGSARPAARMWRRQWTAGSRRNSGLRNNSRAEYRELHKACEATLSQYMREAEALCTLLACGPQVRVMLDQCSPQLRQARWRSYPFTTVQGVPAYPFQLTHSSLPMRSESDSCSISSAGNAAAWLRTRISTGLAQLWNSVRSLVSTLSMCSRRRVSTASR